MLMKGLNWLAYIENSRVSLTQNIRIKLFGWTKYERMYKLIHL